LSSVDLSMGSIREELRASGAPLLACLMLVAICTPVTIQIGPLVLSPSRMLLLLVVVPLFVRLIMGRYGRPMLIDGLMVCHVIWQFVAVSANGVGSAVQFVGSNGLEFFGGYLVARCGIRSREDFIAFVKFFFWIIVFSLPFALLEVQSGRPVLPNFFSSLGLNGLRDVHAEARLGMERAQVFMAHPIHYGLFCSMALALVLIGLANEISRSKRLLMAGVIFAGTVMSVSSGALLPLIIQSALICWAAISHKMKSRWWILLGILTPIYLLLEILSDRPAYLAILTQLAFSAHNVYWRTIIFEWGAQNLADNPIFGLGLRDWVRPVFMRSSSVDNFWLLTGMRFGWPGLLFLATAVLIALVQIIRRPFGPDHPLRNIRLAWVIVMISLILSLATVHVWGAIYSMTMLIFGSGIWLITAPAEHAASDTATADATPVPRRYSRFPIQPGPARRRCMAS